MRGFFLNPFVKGLAPVPVISVRPFCLINYVLCYFDQEYQVYIYCIHLFMYLFIIQLQGIIG